mmetsp:Transcript_7627/g.19684  ORF Transcript_7627/g.19684 Transcript_7627/m.19684 type:complete len:964 (-) Transcript_7627:1622-4513(-)|eukprot:CAMPEP_0182940362 /NCGR_PEP_ID=MMETSP0105_2-20130417/47157_1 /TAXON_ID=81532 ORGANISM="Acanthoeca-like sp., Strain 10tr" /NCGR_SAMPLE_ID=MMETSP0105_2 /ASSEMBLY_ACC=CAM_ASM_000205 /LENGTH=963 /DNA_ID=CAMNT_0025079847 /DNA_START=62 /DNA_END=2953 /DNA_ORIENTATION=-
MFARRPLGVPTVKRKRRKGQQSWVGHPRNRAESIADLVSKMKAGESKLLVVSRIRPMADSEVLRGATETAKIVGDKVVVLLDPAADTEDVLRKNRSREKRYAFDHAFGPGATQVEVYESSCKFLLRGVLDGYNATVFAYGPTGAGKTFTMTGTEANPGVMTRSISDLFGLMSEDAAEVDYTVSINYVEIYNECIRDLLVRGSPDLELREDSDGNAVVCGVKWIEIKSAEEMAKLLREGNARRTQEATKANQASSRSHGILEVRVQRISKSAAKDHIVQTGRLHMIDLAGSERAASTGNHGLRMVEGQHINRSLLALGNCINALGTGSQKYVNFRDSKLTRILKESLGGNCRTVMIACASPASLHFEETYNTMNYANRAKNIKTAAVKNTTVVEAHIVEFGQIVERLKNEVTYLRAKLKAVEGGPAASSPVSVMSPRVKSAERSLAELRRRYDALYVLEQRLQDSVLDEATVTAGQTSPGPSGIRTRRDARQTRSLLEELIEAEKASIARLTATVSGADEEDEMPRVPRPELRHLASQHKLRLAHVSQTTELKLMKMRVMAYERDTADSIRDRIIERQRVLLDSSSHPLPDDLVEMYAELDVVRTRESRRAGMTTDSAAPPTGLLPQLHPPGSPEGPRIGSTLGGITPLADRSEPPEWGEAPAPTLQDMVSGDSSSDAESPTSDDDRVRPSSGPLNKSISSTRSELVDGLSLGGRLARADDSGPSSDRRAPTVSAGSKGKGPASQARQRRSLSGKRLADTISEDGIEATTSSAPAEDASVDATIDDAAAAVATSGNSRSLGETYSTADFKALMSSGEAAVDTSGDGAHADLGPADLRRTYSKAAPFAPAPESDVAAAAVVASKGAAEGVHNPPPPTRMSDLAVVNSVSTPKTGGAASHSTTTPQVAKRTSRPPHRGKPTQSKTRTQRMTSQAPSSLSPSTFGLHISSSPYAVQQRKPRGVRPLK